MNALKGIFNARTLAGRIWIFLAIAWTFALLIVAFAFTGRLRMDTATATSSAITGLMYSDPSGAQAQKHFKSQEGLRNFREHRRRAGPIKDFELVSTVSTFFGVHGWSHVRTLRDRWYVEKIEFHKSRPIRFHFQPEEST